MKLFDVFKKKNNDVTKEYSNNKRLKNRYLDLISQIDENMYINDGLTEELFNEAYKLTVNDVIDRHFLYNKIIEYYYALREKEEDALDKCIKYCQESIEHTPKFLDADKNSFYRSNNEYIPPRIPAFQRLAIIYENQGEYDKSIEICKKAIELKLKDGTKTGFEGRITRLTKKMNK